jgi:hypothetical protein
MAMLLALALLGGLFACNGEQSSLEQEAPVASDPLTLTSPAFGEGDEIPVRYTCDGEDLPPALTWQDVPTGVETYALIMDDPDAPGRTWVHWVLYNIPGEARDLAGNEGISTSVQGENSWGNTGYGGPCPPSGEHRYYFKLYALDTQLELDGGADKEAVLAAMEGHVVAQGQLMGRYESK